MRILYVSQYFPPEIGAPAARVYELSRHWASLGHEVTVLTGLPNHPTGVIPPEYRGRYFVRERVADIDVVRTPIYVSANRGVLKRSLNYCSYALSAATLGPLRVARPDVVIATSPQFLTGLAGAWISLLERAPFVFEVRDLWPKSIVEVGAMKADNPIVKALERTERALYRRADLVVSVTDSFVDHIAEHGASRSKIAVIKNGVDLALFAPRPLDDALRTRHGLEGKFVATYIGTHGMAHGLDTVLEAAKRLADSPAFHFVLVGEGAHKEALVAAAAAQGLSNVTFVGQQAKAEMPRWIACSDVTLVLLRDLPLFRSVIPSKIFEFMAGARPIVLGVEGEAKGLVERAGAGICIRPERADELVAALRELQANPERRAELGRRGRAYVEANFSRRVLAERYLEVLRGVVDRVASRGTDDPHWVPQRTPPIL